MTYGKPLSDPSLERVWRGLKCGESLRTMANGRCSVASLDRQIWDWRARLAGAVSAPLD